MKRCSYVPEPHTLGRLNRCVELSRDVVAPNACDGIVVTLFVVYRFSHLHTHQLRTAAGYRHASSALATHY
jgi:hypothetical protein